MVPLAPDPLRLGRVDHTGTQLINLFKGQFLCDFLFLLVLIAPLFVIQLNDSEVFELELLLLTAAILGLDTFCPLFTEVIELIVGLQEGLFLTKYLCSILDIFFNDRPEFKNLVEQELIDLGFEGSLSTRKFFIKAPAILHQQSFQVSAGRRLQFLLKGHFLSQVKRTEASIQIALDLFLHLGSLSQRLSPFSRKAKLA